MGTIEYICQGDVAIIRDEKHREIARAYQDSRRMYWDLDMNTYPFKDMILRALDGQRNTF